MTDKSKIKHIIEVLTELVQRYRDSQCINEIPDQSLTDLIKLLQKPHSTGGKPPVPPSIAATQAAEMLRDLIKGRKPNFREPNMKEWWQEMDKIIRIDKRTPEQLEAVVRWSQQDSFWANNILSPSKLRKQLDRLELQMSGDFHWQKGKLQRTVKDGPTPKEIYMKGLKQ